MQAKWESGREPARGRELPPNQPADWALDLWRPWLSSISSAPANQFGRQILTVSFDSSRLVGVPDASALGILLLAGGGGETLTGGAVVFADSAGDGAGTISKGLAASE